MVNKKPEDLAETRERLQYWRKQLPVPAAFQNIAICLRKFIRERRKLKQDYGDLLTDLYQNAVHEDFFIATPCLDLVAINETVLHSITKSIMREIDCLYEKIGYENLSQLNKTDIKWLTEEWGEPSQHSSAKDQNEDLWKSAVEQFKTASAKEEDKEDRFYNSIGLSETQGDRQHVKGLSGYFVVLLVIIGVIVLFAVINAIF